MQIDFEKLSKTLDSTFPKVDYVIAYGSSIFPQEGYDYQKEKPLIDLIFIVSDSDNFHKDNYLRNPTHYTGLGYVLGPFFLRILKKHFFPIHFNPLITVDGFSFKYGVVEYMEFIYDLNEWQMLSLAGRTQKPIKILKQPQNERNRKEFANALGANRASALAVALLMNIHTPVVEEFIVYETLVSLSYTGDIRFAVGAENHEKIKKIVSGQYTHLSEIYRKLMLDERFNKIITLHDSENLVEFKGSKKSRTSLVDMIPHGLGAQLGGSVKDYKEIMARMENEELQRSIAKGLQKLNQWSSTRMMFYHMFTTSPIKNFVYIWAKVKKRLFK